MAESYELGMQGEELAVAHLRKIGYEILERRWHDHHMEIDIVAFDPETKELVSVEVKTRSTADWGAPEEAVDTKKIRRSVYATDFYMKLHHITYSVRFDIFSIIIPKGGGTPQVNHIRDAFYPPLG